MPWSCANARPSGQATVSPTLAGPVGLVGLVSFQAGVVREGADSPAVDDLGVLRSRAWSESTGLATALGCHKAATSLTLWPTSVRCAKAGADPLGVSSGMRVWGQGAAFADAMLGKVDGLAPDSPGKVMAA